MQNFIPRNEKEVQKIKEELSRTLFESPQKFVKFYNSNVINKNLDDIKKIAEQITSAFKDIEEKNKKLVFLSEEEIYLSEITEKLEPWNIIVKAKREIETALKEKVIDENATLGFFPDMIGYLCEQRPNDVGDDEVVRFGSEKLFTKQDDVRKIFEKISSLYPMSSESAKDDEYLFKVKDFINLDASFIKQIHSIIENVEDF